MSALTAKLDLDASGLKRGATQAGTAIAGVSKDLKALGGDIDDVDSKDVRVQVEADIAKAEKNLSELRTSLLDVDGMDARADVYADIDRAETDLNKLRGDLDDLDATVAEPRIDVPDADNAGGAAGFDFAAGAIKSIGAAGIGAAVVTAFNRGVDRIQMQARFQSEFGLVTADAERFGGQAGDIYADGWGTGLEQVLTAVGRVDQALVATGEIAANEADDMVVSALAIADVWGVDVNDVIRSAGLLMKNDLASSATEATDIIISGLQNGANEADDFWDTINEYSQHFDAMGLSGADMNAIIIAGFQAGQRDADKLADAIKEMRLRATDGADATSEAYASLGLNADEYRSKILAGGDSARTATVEILKALQSTEDKTVMNTAAVALIGTQYEDIGPQAIDILLAIDGATQDVTGSTEELVAVQAAATSEIEMLWRQVSGVVGTASEEVAESVNTWTRALGTGEGSFYNWTQEVKGANELTGTFVEWAGSGAAAAAEFGTSVDKSTFALGSNVAALDDNTDATEESAEAVAEHEAAIRDEVAALIASAEAILDRVDAAKAAADATFALNDAEDDFIETLEKSNETLQDGEADLRDVRSAMDDAAQAAGKLADAELRVAEETAAQSGATLTATQKLDIQNGAMLSAAATADGPLRQSIINYIGSLNGIPEEETTDILALLDEGKVDEAEAALNNASRTRNQTTTADAQTGQAESSLNYLARDRVSNLRVVINQEGRVTLPGGARVYDSGGTIAAGQFGIAAEKRPEFVNGVLLTTPSLIQGPAQVTSGSETARMLASASTAHTPSFAGSNSVATSDIRDVTIVNPKASATVADLSMALRMARR